MNTLDAPSGRATGRARRLRPLVFALSGALAACGASAESAASAGDAGPVPRTDARPTSDVDAAPVPDVDAAPVPEVDARAPAPDAGVFPGDARPDAGEPPGDAVPTEGPDAGEEPDADPPEDPDAGFVGTACTVDGVDGLCLATADCPADHHPTPGFCPGPADIQCCTAGPPPPPGVCDADVLVRPAALPAEAPGDPGCPAGMGRVEAFCVDRYEAALVERTDAGEVPWSPYHHPGERAVRAVSVAGVVPQGYIDGDRAGAACAASGKRLCTDAEWLRACQGPDGLTYPYGAARMPGICNDARDAHPAIELFPDDPTPFDRLQDACLNQLPESLASAGAHPGCVSAEGLFDLMGNLHEWTADPEGTFRGGSFVDTAINGNGCLYRTTAHDTAHWDYSTGFRCCADALP